jgi:hypothetical protein
VEFTSIAVCFHESTADGHGRSPSSDRRGTSIEVLLRGADNMLDVTQRANVRDLNSGIKFPSGEEQLVMRKRYRILLVAAIVAAIVVPLGLALSLESDSRPSAPTPGILASTSSSSTVVSSVLVSAGDPPTVGIVHSVPDSAKFFIVGTVLFGLAAAVRKAA